jgi:hypothetical protein
MPVNVQGLWYVFQQNLSRKMEQNESINFLESLTGKLCFKFKLRNAYSTSSKLPWYGISLTMN